MNDYFERLPASIRDCPQPAAVRDILNTALAAVDPEQAVRRALHLDGTQLSVGGRRYDLAAYRKIYVVGAGKAGEPMAQAVVDMLGVRLDAGLVIVKDGHAHSRQLGRVEIAEAGHPLPDERGVTATNRLVRLLETAGEFDLVLLLLSGGGSALLTSPLAGLRLADLQSLTSQLLACGASIDEINALRKHLDGVKGGRLAQIAAPAQLICLILSDVVGSPLGVIASGPAAPDESTFADAWGVLERNDLLARAPAAVISQLRVGLADPTLETPKPGSPLFARVQTVLVGSNPQAAEAALAQARAAGFNALLLTTYLQGEASQAGRFLAAVLRQITESGEPAPRPACLIAGGETTVTLRGAGLGGRNQELALGALADLSGLENVLLVTLATDGGDGPTPAAGAAVSAASLRRAQAAGLAADDYLRRNDAYHFFAGLDDLLVSGPTRTNVNDLAFLFAF